MILLCSAYTGILILIIVIIQIKEVYITSIEGFRSFAKVRLMIHHEISKEKFLYSIKYMEWRYNNREIDLWGVL